jgi:predicted TIM-barrel fold metal-dependent hydrolase
VAARKVLPDESEGTMPTPLSERMSSELDSIALIDTHEHLLSEALRLQQPSDIFTLTADYVGGDLVSAGMPPATMVRLVDPSVALEDRWRDFAPYWPKVRTTGFGRAVTREVRDLFGVDRIDDETYRDISERISAANKPGWFEHVLKERAKVEIAANQSIPEFDPTPIERMDRRYCLPVICLDDFVTVSSRGGLEALERRSGLAIHTLDDLVAAMDLALDRGRSAGAVALKILLAYRRSLDFERTATADAERVFNRLLRHASSWLPDLHEPAPVSWDEARPLQDFLVLHLVRRCAALGLPIQIHTGLQAGNGNRIANADPSPLACLFLDYPEARFALFHAGYPFHGVTTTLGKTFPNVYLDLCWVPLISPSLARAILREWIEVVPVTKIMAFGGDSTIVEGAYAAARAARDVVAGALADEVEAGYLEEGEAPEVARLVLRDNAIGFLSLERFLLSAEAAS